MTSLTGSGDRSVHELIDAVPWGRLTHAYDFALDVPAVLHAQVGARDVDAGFEDWIFSSIVHQGTPYSATAPTLWLMRRIIEADAPHPALGTCLSAIAECATALECARSPREPTARDDPTADRVWYRSPPGDPLWSSMMPPDYTTPSMVNGRVDDDYFRAAAADLETLTACVLDWQTVISGCLNERSHRDDAISAAVAITAISQTGSAPGALNDLVS